MLDPESEIELETVVKIARTLNSCGIQAHLRLVFHILAVPDFACVSTTLNIFYFLNDFFFLWRKRKSTTRTADGQFPEKAFNSFLMKNKSSDN